jgi:glycosyltransferase involved in cell wall biosynthesis
MRIVDLCPYGVHPPRSGGHQLVHQTSTHLGARHHVFVFAMGLRRFDGLRLRSFSQRPGGRYVEYRHVTPLTYLSFLRRGRSGLPPLRASAELRLTAPPILRRELAAADVVQVEGPWQLAFAKRLAQRAPIVLVVQNAEGALLRQRGISQRLCALAARIEAQALGAADAVVALCREDLAALEAEHSARPRRAYVCGAGTDTEAFRPAGEMERTAARTALGLSGPVALFAGSWHLPNRSALAALRALATQMPEWTFLVVGSVAIPEESAGNVRAIGSVADVGTYFRAADVALNPMTEGSGVNLKVLDYLAAGLPTVSTRFGSRGLEVDDVVEVVELDGFPAALRALAAPERRMARGGAARKAAETRFSWDAVARARERIYEELVRDVAGAKRQ